jgi:hypothetical protein
MQNPVLPVVIALLLLDAAMSAGFEIGEDAKTKQIAEAIIQAYSLEADYWRNPERYDSWQKLYDHYRLGFSAEIAEQLTEFTRTQDGDMATWTPYQVRIIEHDEDSALAWFPTPEDFTHGPWALRPYMMVRLRREQNRWVIHWAADQDTLPEQP